MYIAAVHSFFCKACHYRATVQYQKCVQSAEFLFFSILFIFFIFNFSFYVFFLYKFDNLRKIFMRLFRVQRKFTKAKSHFLPIFSQQVALAKQASVALCGMVKSGDYSEWAKLEKEVKQCEIQGDALLAEFYETLYEVLIYPIDRDDLQMLAMYIDEFLDQINTSAKSMMLYRPKKVDQPLMDLAQYVDMEADAMINVISSMADMKANFSSLVMQCDRITELEHAGDDSYEEYIGEIFRNEKDAIELMKYKNLAEVFEATTDRAKKFSDHVRKILLRYVN